ncbi:hypothetical protein BUALT_Bualt02G0246000 [Buddleja alternifolia]|uniref:Uncharacterized protein n=1 Tax=Buddleja alternifolia TaxID=168488 RepID=A0AAV6Y323_9LAMI|nr:hypothetical protein BUALT_Bualt02G0246000 [Buddleja alternifolia]
MDVKEMKTINGDIPIHEEEEEEESISIRKGAWSYEEDSILINCITIHGQGRWNHLARNAGLKRTGKSCRLRWLNYLRPNIRRGNFTPEEQLRIIQLHCSYGNRWSKIAEYLPGRTDNEIKNFWRTRVHKLAKQLKFDINSAEFRDFIINIWLPTMSEQIQASEAHSCNYIDHTSSDGVLKTTGPEPLQMDYWAEFSEDVLSDPVEANPVSVLDGRLDFFSSPFISYGFVGMESQPSFNSEDDFFWLWSKNDQQIRHAY